MINERTRHINTAYGNALYASLLLNAIPRLHRLSITFTIINNCYIITFKICISVNNHKYVL